MSGKAYYNEIDKFCAQWLRNLIAAGHIAPGDVDERSIKDVKADDLKGYTQCHWFAGIGIWSAALRQAGWPDERPVWTGSCPCQPLSAAGKGLGTADERHLWPVWFELIKHVRPLVIFGEQVASPDGLAWLDIVCTDLENTGHAVWPIDLCAAGFGAPNIRQRLWWMANAASLRHERGGQAKRCHAPGRSKNLNDFAMLALGDADGARRPLGIRIDGNDGATAEQTTGQAAVETGAVNGFWRDADWIECTDGKARPVEPGTFPLAHGYPQRVGKLRAYGNAINQEVAAHFILASTGALREEK